MMFFLVVLPFLLVNAKPDYQPCMPLDDLEKVITKFLNRTNLVWEYLIAVLAQEQILYPTPPYSLLYRRVHATKAIYNLTAPMEDKVRETLNNTEITRIHVSH
ncbi:hypothetical protein OSTOST_12968 [Ostertagia ostertagi]